MTVLGTCGRHDKLRSPFPFIRVVRTQLLVEDSAPHSTCLIPLTFVCWREGARTVSGGCCASMLYGTSDGDHMLVLWTSN